MFLLIVHKNPFKVILELPCLHKLPNVLIRIGTYRDISVTHIKNFKFEQNIMDFQNEN